MNPQAPLLKLKAPFSLLPKQATFLDATERYVNYTGGFGSGKTFILCARGIIESLQHPRNFGLLGCQSYPMLRDTMLRTFMDVVDMFQKAVDGEGLGIELLKEYKIGENKVVLYNDSEIILRSLGIPQDVGKLKSLNLGWAGIDEPTDINFNTFRMLQGRIRLAGVGHHIFMTGNPAGFSNWVYKFFYEDAAEGDRMHIDATSKENIFLPGDYVKDLEKYDESYYRRYVLGQWGDIEGMVYKDWSRDIHVIEPFKIPSAWTKVRGLDFGHTNPFVCLWVAFDADNRAYLYNEHYQAKELIKHHAGVMNSMSGKEEYYATYMDPSAAQEIAELRPYGIYPTETLNDVEVGIQKVQERLKVQADRKPRLYVFSTCINTIKEFEVYRWKIQKGEKNEYEEPEKSDDHCLVAGTKVMCLDGEKNIEDVVVGDLVLTRVGWHSVLKSGKTLRNQLIFEVSLSNGRCLCGTGSHPVFVKDRGFIPIDTLRYGDLLKKATYERVLNAYPHLNMQANIHGAGTGNTCFGLARNLRHGINQRPAVNGIVNTVKKIGKVENQKRNHVSSAKNNLNTISKGQNTVQVLASRKLSAREDVYDLTVDGAHEFYANGVLVHNSMDALRYILYSYDSGSKLVFEFID